MALLSFQKLSEESGAYWRLNDGLNGPQRDCWVALCLNRQNRENGVFFLNGEKQSSF